MPFRRFSFPQKTPVFQTKRRFKNQKYILRVINSPYMYLLLYFYGIINTHLKEASGQPDKKR